MPVSQGLQQYPVKKTQYLHQSFRSHAYKSPPAAASSKSKAMQTVILTLASIDEFHAFPDFPSVFLTNSFFFTTVPSQDQYIGTQLNGCRLFAILIDGVRWKQQEEADKVWSGDCVPTQSFYRLLCYLRTFNIDFKISSNFIIRFYNSSLSSQHTGWGIFLTYEQLLGYLSRCGSF